MPTVQQAVDILSQVTGVPRRHVNILARRLIDDGLLPKSVGSRIAQTDLKGVALLLFAIARADKIQSAGTIAREFAKLPHLGARPLFELSRDRIHAAARISERFDPPSEGPSGDTLASFVSKHILAPGSQHRASLRLSRDTSGQASAVITFKGPGGFETQHLFCEDPDTSPLFFQSATLTAQAVDLLRDLLAGEKQPPDSEEVRT